MTGSTPWTPSRDRNALDRLLRFVPHFDLLAIEIGEEYLKIELGQPSQTGDAWARYHYVIDRHSGCIYHENRSNPRDLWLLNI